MLTASIAIYEPNLQMIANLFKSFRKYNAGLKQVIIFNNSPLNESITQEVLRLAKVYIPHIHILINKSCLNENVGFGEAHNLNVLHATQPYFAVLNDDIEFYEEWVHKLCNPLINNTNVAQVSIKNGQCNVVDIYGDGAGVDIDEPEYCEGSCFVMRTELFLKELFDSETYKLGYFEDTDLSFRLKKQGFSLSSVSLKWKHHRAQSSVKVIGIGAIREINKHKFLKKWYSYIVGKKFGETIAVKRTGSLGDVLLVTPILEQLRNKYPDTSIILLTEAKGVVGYPLIDIELPIGFPCYFDRLIDLDYAYEKDFSIHIIDAYAKVADVEVKSKRGILYTPKSAIENILQNYLPDKSFFENKVAFLDLSDTWTAKQWHHSNYEKLSKKLRADGIKVVLVGKTKKPIYVEYDWSLLNVLSITEAAASLLFADIYVGHDGFLAHAAQAVDTPAVVLYTVCKPELVANLSSKILKPVVADIKCQGCIHLVQTYSVHCTNNFECVNTITVDEVYKSVKEIIG